MPRHQGDGISIDCEGSASASGAVSDNAITITEQVGIHVASPDGELSADVIGNRIAGAGSTGMESGISVFRAAAGTSIARILGNLMTHAAASAGAEGILVNAAGGTISFEIASNTVADSEFDIEVSGRQGGIAVGSVANNIITGGIVVGLHIDSPGVVSNQNNLFFGNQADVQGGSAGAGSLFEDPHYAGIDDYHLEPGSKAIDAGDDAAVPADLTTDLDGNPRIRGSHVDVGAYETAPEPAGASLVALWAVAAVARGRARMAPGSTT